MVKTNSSQLVVAVFICCAFVECVASVACSHIVLLCGYLPAGSFVIQLNTNYIARIKSYASFCARCSGNKIQLSFIAFGLRSTTRPTIRPRTRCAVRTGAHSISYLFVWQTLCGIYFYTKSIIPSCSVVS